MSNDVRGGVTHAARQTHKPFGLLDPICETRTIEVIKRVRKPLNIGGGGDSLISGVSKALVGRFGLEGSVASTYLCLLVAIQKWNYIP